MGNGRGVLIEEVSGCVDKASCKVGRGTRGCIRRVDERDGAAGEGDRRDVLITWVGINEGIPVGVTSVTIAMSTAAEEYPATER